MKTLLPAFIYASLTMMSCTTDRNIKAALTAKGCDINSIRKQSELVFKKMDKRKKTPDGYFKTEIFENDSLIIIQRLATNRSSRNTGAIFAKISKATCKVVEIEVLQ